MATQGVDGVMTGSTGGKGEVTVKTASGTNYINTANNNNSSSYNVTDSSGKIVIGTGYNQKPNPVIEPTEPTNTDDDGDGKGGDGGGGGTWSGGGGSSSSAVSRTIVSDPTTLAEMQALKKEKTDSQSKVNTAVGAIDNLEAPTIDRVDKLSTVEYENMLKQLKAAQEQQVQNNVDYATNQGITELQRAEQDAQSSYQTTRAQIDTDEKRALDNQALYARARGDNGGIGVEQYNSIQNTAAVNRMTVNKEQTKLATDTQRQIADLRAQGEYDKADKLLSITQNYLSQLMSLKQWADETNLSIDEFNISVAQWEENYKMSLAQAKLSAAGTLYDMANTDYTNYMNQMASAGQALMQAGITPTAEQISAMAWTQQNALDYLNGYYKNGVVSIT